MLFDMDRRDSILRSLAIAAGLVLTAMALAGPVRGSGRLWRCLYAWGRDGTGPPNTALQVCTPVDGTPGYRLSLFEDDPPHHLIWTKAYPEAIRFRRLEVHANPVNDFWQEGGLGVKQFPKLLFVGQGRERGRSVTLVWSCGDEGARSIKLLLKVYGGDASRLDQPDHGSRQVGGIVVEHARASWLPAASRPRWARPSDRIRRVWTYAYPAMRFHPGPWRRDRAL